MGYFPTGWQAKNVELTANVTQLMEAERNTRLTPVGKKRGFIQTYIRKVLGCSCILSKGNEPRKYISYMIYTYNPGKMSARYEVQHLELGSPPLTSSHGWKGHCPIQSFNMWMMYSEALRWGPAMLLLGSWKLTLLGLGASRSPRKRGSPAWTSDSCMLRYCGVWWFFGVAMSCWETHLVRQQKIHSLTTKVFLFVKIHSFATWRPWSLPTKVIAGMWLDVWLVPWSIEACDNSEILDARSWREKEEEDAEN